MEQSSLLQKSSSLSNSILRRAIATSSNHIILTDPEGRIVFANKAAEKLTGFSFAEMKGQTPALWGRQMPTSFYKELWHTIKVRKKPFVGVITNRRKNGQQYFAQARITPIKKRSGELIGFIGTEEDVTKDVLLKGRLELQYTLIKYISQTNMSLRQVVRKILQAICQLQNWVVSDYFAQVWLVDSEETVLKCVETWHAPGAGVTAFIDATKKLEFHKGEGLPGAVWRTKRPMWIMDIASGSREIREFKRGDIAKQIGLKSAFAFPILSDGEVVGVLEFFGREEKSVDRDFLNMFEAVGKQIGQYLKRKDYQKAIQSQNVKIEKGYIRDQAILESIAEGIIVVDTKMRITSVNKAAADLLHKDPESLTGKLFLQTVNLVDTVEQPYAHAQHPVVRALSSKEVVVLGLNGEKCQLCTKAGQCLPLYLIASPLSYQGKMAGCVVVLRDIAEEARIDQLKSEFVSLVSHQLKAPLVTLRWYAEALSQKKPNQDKELVNSADYVEEVYAATLRMIHLVDNLLVASRVDLGKTNPNVTQIEVQGVVDEALSDLQRDFTQRKQQFQLHLSAEPKTIHNDKQLIIMVVQNLLSNANKYTQAGGKISMTVHSDSQELRITVRDNGYGIPDKVKPKIFTRFYRGENIVKREPSGNGLGLYAIKSFIEKAGGKIYFESKPKQGTVFYVSLPNTSPK